MPFPAEHREHSSSVSDPPGMAVGDAGNWRSRHRFSAGQSHSARQKIGFGLSRDSLLPGMNPNKVVR